MSVRNEPPNRYLSVINRVEKLFMELSWPTVDDVDNEGEIFSKFCSMLSLLTKDEQDLILDITKDFYDCTLAKYNRAIKEAIDNIDLSKLPMAKEIISLPLIKPEDREKVKSGPSMVYLAKDRIHKFAARNGLNCKELPTPSLLVKYADRGSSIILFIDDFIGSGETVRRALEDYNINYRVASDIPVVLALVAQQEAVTQVMSLGIYVAVGIIRKKGITDSVHIQDKVLAHAIMDSIEDKLDISTFYRHGYLRSEALVCMVRCPDNTFPVYWHDGVYNWDIWPAPFRV